MWDNLTVNGFRFDDAKEFAQAKREVEAIEYITMKMDVTDPNTAVKVYYKLLERQSLHTVVGISFLKELRNTIITSGIVSDEDLKCIDVLTKKREGRIESFGDETSLAVEAATPELEPPSTEDPAVIRERRATGLMLYYKQCFSKARIVIVVLALVIIGMFIITATSDRSPFADMETEIQNKYAEWEEELEQRERELDEREGEISGSSN